MAIIAQGSKTIIDMTDGKMLSAYLGSNQPRIQIYDVNAGTYTPDWTTTPGRLVITPVIYANQTAIALNNPALSITWKRKEGSSSEGVLTTGEVVSANTLIVSANQLSSAPSSLLTYIAYVTYTDPDTTLPINTVVDIPIALVTTGENAKSAWISGEQVFKYAAGGEIASPTQIVLTANLQGVTMAKWQYKNDSDAWVDYPTTADNETITGTTLVVKPTHAIWIGESAALRIVTSDEDIGDTTSIYKVTDGATGAAGLNGMTVILSNAAHTLPKTTGGTVAYTGSGTTIRVYEGATELPYDETGTANGTWKITPTATGITCGMPIEHSGLYATVPDHSAMAGDTANITYSVSGKRASGAAFSIEVTQTFSISLQGATGNAGANAIVFAVYAPNGTVFVNQTGALTLQGVGYDGSNVITSGAAYAWEKYTAGSWTTVSGATASSLTVNGDEVVGMASYRCTMTYANQTYRDIIALIDKTDNYQAEIDSTAGDIFKNAVGTSCLICRLWQNGTEVDALKSTTYSATAPTSPTIGQVYYKITTSTPTTALMRYSGSEWVDVTAEATYQHTKIYTWYRRDMNGTTLNGGAIFATGKVISIDGDHVENKTVFVCEVE